MDVWVVVDVGCIECGAETHLVGVFQREDDARLALGERRAKEDADDDGRYFGRRRRLEMFKAEMNGTPVAA